jgi:glycosyltransferase involved in cell wall biosynthesis
VRILHVVPTYLPARRYGGPIFAVHGLAKSLAARGHDVDVITTNVDGDSVSDVPVATPVDLDGVHVRYFPSPMRRLYWSPQIRKALREHVHEHDVVHLHSVFLWPTYAAATAARDAKIPYVISPRGMLVKELIARKSTLVKKAWIRLIERRNFASASSIHFTSQREWDDAKAIGLPLPSPFIVPNGIVLPPIPNVARDDATIVFLGRINWKKGLDRLIAALPNVANATLEIAGNDDENYTPRLKELAQRLGVAHRTNFRGAVNGDAKYELLRRATLFALPSMSENFGNSVLEAMAMETPVVVTPEVGLSSEVARAHSGIVTSGAPRELGEAITSLLRDPERRAELGARGRRLVEEKFIWSRVAAEMEREYERLRR